MCKKGDKRKECVTKEGSDWNILLDLWNNELLISYFEIRQHLVLAMYMQPVRRVDSLSRAFFRFARSPRGGAKFRGYCEFFCCYIF